MRTLLRQFKCLILLFIAIPQFAHGSPGAVWLNTCRAALARGRWSARIPIPESSNVKWIDDAHELELAKTGMENAFHDDPSIVWMTTNPELRRRLIRSLINHTFIHGGVLSTKWGNGAALWMDQDKVNAGFFSMVMAGQLQLVPRFGFHTWKMLNYDHFCTAVLDRHIAKMDPKPDIIKLFVIGVDPDSQGQGIGSALIEPVLQHADREGKHVVLETANPKNVGYYERFGFVRLSTERYAPDYPVAFFMMRAPRR